MILLITITTTTATTTEERQRRRGAAVVVARTIGIVVIGDVAVVGVVGADYADAFITTTTCSITAAAAAAAAPEVCVAVGEGLFSTDTAAGVGFVVRPRRRRRGRLAALERRQELTAHPTLVSSTAAAGFRCLLLGHPFQLPEVAARVVGLSAAGREQVDGRIALRRSAQAADAAAFKNFSLRGRDGCSVLLVVR